MSAQNQDLSEDRVTFDWQNNRTVTEHQMMTRADQGPTGELSAWKPASWETSSVTDVDSLLASFRSDPKVPDHCIDLEDERETADTVRAVSVTYRTWKLRIRVRRVYPGLYDNVERLRDFIRTLPLDDDPRDLASTVDDALQMILCHDRGERDQLTPEGHCRHGVYVGGCGIDWMCGACEDGSQ